MLTKKCGKCKDMLPLDLFGKKCSKTGKLQSYCKECDKAYKKENLPRQREKYGDKWRCKRLQRRYGITLEDFNVMAKKTDNKCYICNNPELATDYRTGFVKPLSVDHCHKTGEVRGLLCNRCNRSIGKFEDDVELLKKAIKYLEEHNMKQQQVFRGVE